ncbi:MAG: hypothetical protein ABI670_10295 [Chloroflexota bacterium]
MSNDNKGFKGNLDAGNSEEEADNKSGGGLFGGLSGLTHAAQEAAKQSDSDTLSGSIFGGIGDLTHAAKEAGKQADKTTLGGGFFGGVADAADAAREAAQQAEAAQRAAAQRAADAASAQAAQTSDFADEEEFVGSGGVGGGDQLEAIRRGYAERGMADPSALGGPDSSIVTADSGETTDNSGFQGNLDSPSGSSGSED